MILGVVSSSRGYLRRDIWIHVFPWFPNIMHVQENLCFQRNWVHIIDFSHVHMHWVIVSYKLHEIYGWTCFIYVFWQWIAMGSMRFRWACFQLGESSSSLNMGNFSFMNIGLLGEIPTSLWCFENFYLWDDVSSDKCIACKMG